MTPCFAAVYAGLPLMPMIPAPEEVLTIAPPPCLRDQWNLVLHTQEDAPQVDVDDPVPLLLVVVGGRSRLPRLDAGVVEGEVQVPEGCECLVQRGLHIVGLCNA